MIGKEDMGMYRLNLTSWIILSALLTLLLSGITAAEVIYVDIRAPGPDHDGNSWDTGYLYLQDALAGASVSGKDIRVAAGIYTPDRSSADPNGSGERTAAFALISGITISGGYAGYASPDPNHQDVELYETILSGDLDDNDVDVNDPCDLLTEPTRGENSYHVIVGSNTDANAVLDGFTITGGNGNTVEIWPTSNGGGMLNDHGNCTISNCKFIENSAQHCGAIYNHESSIQVTNCTFIRNASQYDAGAIHNTHSHPTVTNCIFSENRGTRGGAIFNFSQSEPVLNGCTFVENQASEKGGGVFSTGSNPSLTNCVFSGNSATDYGGGIYSSNDSNVAVVGCSFSLNIAGLVAGAMYNHDSNVVAINCDFSGNHSSERVGGMYNSASTSALTNCIFSGNWAPFDAGGMQIDGNSVTTLVNCVFASNTSSGDGGAIVGGGSGTKTMTVANCIFWGNADGGGSGEDAQIDSATLSAAVVTYSCIQDDDSNDSYIPFGGAGNNNIDDDPCFISEPNDGGDGWGEGNNDNFGDAHLGPNSPCIDAGDNDMVPSDSADLDNDGNTAEVTPYGQDNGDRFRDDPNTTDTGNGSGNIIDIGGIEFGPRRIYVGGPSVPLTGNTGRSWSTAYSTLQDGLKKAGFVNEIWVAKGTHRPDPLGIISPTSGNRSLSFVLKRGMRVYGGFAGNETARSQRDWITNRTVLSGDLNQDDGPNFTKNSDNSYHVVTAIGLGQNTATLDGFTITAGNADGQPWIDDKGAGIFHAFSKVTVANCIVIGNFAKAYGGGMYNMGYGPTYAPILTNCMFVGNAGDSGGGVYNSGEYGRPSSISLTNCTFNGNTAKADGGGLYTAGTGFGATVTMTNCSLSSNTAGSDGGGIYNSSNSNLMNCTFGGNTAAGNGGGIYDSSASMTVENSILWSNADGGGTDESAQIHTGTVTVNYSCIQGLTGGLGGTGNTSSDPVFVDPDGIDGILGTIDDNLRIVDGSACIDTGDNTAVPADTADLDSDGNTGEQTPLDLDKAPRFTDDPVTADGGSGTPPIVDMGAYEYQPPIYVDIGATGTNNGSSWVNAFNYLQDGLATASRGVQVRVASGIYHPDDGVGQTPGNRNATFALKQAVPIYGGFQSAGGSWSQRDAGNNETVLSGDLTGNDQSGFVNYGENSYHVVSASRIDHTALIDGFTITAGNADSNIPPDNGGAGMLNTNTSCGVGHCLFSENQAWVLYGTQYGGGMVNLSDSRATIADCNFLSNRANNGGGMANFDSSPTSINCAFNDNDANLAGGGVYTWQSNSKLIDCRFNGNLAFWAGGMFGTGNIFSRSWLTRCHFSENHASQGGAMYIAGGVSLVRCDFSKNKAGIRGGAIFNFYGAEMANCTFSGNWVSGGNGGAIYLEGSGEMMNCRLIGNTAGQGGGMYSNVAQGFSQSMTAVNSTFSGNVAEANGGGIFEAREAIITLANCILWGNVDPAGNIEKAQITGGVQVVYSCIQDDNPADSNVPFGGAINGNIDDDPLFVRDPFDGGNGWVDDPITPGVDESANNDYGDVHLSAGRGFLLFVRSPCIDAGDNNWVYNDVWDIDNDSDGIELMPWDLGCKLRFVDDPRKLDTGNAIPTGLPVVDMGVYEFACRGDFDRDGDVDGSDLGGFSTNWLDEDCGEDEENDDETDDWCGCTDTNQDGKVNFEDYADFAKNWLVEPDI